MRQAGILLALTMLSCASTPKVDSYEITDNTITVDQLSQNPERYLGKHIFVKGFLFWDVGRVGLLPLENKDCSIPIMKYSPYLITSISGNELQRTSDRRYWQQFKLSGRTAIISGIFYSESNALSKFDSNIDPYGDLRSSVIGPLMSAKIVVVFDSSCYLKTADRPMP